MAIFLDGGMFAFNASSRLWTTLISDAANEISNVTMPGARASAALWVDATNSLAWVFGGTDRNGATLGDLWNFRLPYSLATHVPNTNCTVNYPPGMSSNVLFIFCCA
jgi:hypothetical protein